MSDLGEQAVCSMGDSEGLAEAAEKKEKEGAEFQRKPGF